MPDHQLVDVALGDRAYPIRIGHDWLDKLSTYLPPALQKIEHAAILADEAVLEPWATKVERALAAADRRVHLLTIPSGESSKNADQLVRIWNWLLENRADRQTVIVAIGGGVVGDLAGMVAATFTRGLRFLQIPTTLLAQVDSSVGGKTGINLPAAKNMVGCFWQPNFVAIDTATLSTLPVRETCSGWAEIVKYGVILDADFFDYLEKHVDDINNRNPEVLAFAIRRSCELKAQVVVADERETTGLRACLNYGHTFAHAIEATAGYGTYLHGEAVSIGMQMAAHLAASMGLISEAFVTRQRRLLDRLHLPTTQSKPDVAAMMKAMQHDKKVAHGKLRFILPDRVGHVSLVGNVDPALVQQAIEQNAS